MESSKEKYMKENKNADKPSFVYRDGMTADTEYVEWLSDVKKTFPSEPDKSIYSCEYHNA